MIDAVAADIAASLFATLFFEISNWLSRHIIDCLDKSEEL